MTPTRPTLALGALGGTIAMTADHPDAPVTPGLDADALIQAVPGLEQVANINSSTLALVASPSLDMDHIRRTLSFARTAVEEGATGVVITHGTDTLEETAWLLDLCWDRPEPIVITGAMRSPNLLSADGPANIKAATITAVSAESRGLGVLVCLDDTVHAARYVAKTNTTALWTFQSPGWGPLGRVIEGELRLGVRPTRNYEPLPDPTADPVRVPVVECGFADDGWLLKHVLSLNPDGIVLAGLGVGHMSEAAARVAIAGVESGIPFVLSTRTGSGTTLQRTYGYFGSESHLLSQGLIGSGFLGPRRSRLLLHLLVQQGLGRDAIAERFAARSR